MTDFHRIVFIVKLLKFLGDWTQGIILKKKIEHKSLMDNKLFSNINKQLNHLIINSLLLKIMLILIATNNKMHFNIYNGYLIDCKNNNQNMEIIFLLYLTILNVIKWYVQNVMAINLFKALQINLNFLFLLPLRKTSKTSINLYKTLKIKRLKSQKCVKILNILLILMNA